MKVSMTEAEVMKAVEHYVRDMYRLYPVEGTIVLSHYSTNYCAFEVDDVSAIMPPQDSK